MFVWNAKIIDSANFELKRIKTAKVVFRRAVQASFVPIVVN